MKKILFIFAMVIIPSIAFSQVKDKEAYIYNIVTLSGDFDDKKIKVTIDNGEAIEKLTDKEGNRIIFKTPAAVLMYFIHKGWEIYVSGTSTSGGSYGGTGSTESKPYWIIRKPCSKDEFEKIVQKGIVKQ